MAYIKEYWIDKEKRAEQARRHTQEMQDKYKNDIELSINKTRIYGASFTLCDDDMNEKNTEIIVEDLDTVNAGHKYQSGITALLNFSSYKNPGGMFINGSKAQEECLCHASCLYNVLSRLTSKFYDWNNRNKNKSLYLNRGLYSPRIAFEHNGDVFFCDVITCAAPNKSSAQKYCNVSDEENAEVLKSRIKFVLDIARHNHVDTLILGAYGCGVFGQDPYEVATIFKEYLETTHKCFEKVVFAIPKGSNYDAFVNVIGNVN